MKTKKDSQEAPRNPIAVAMVIRHSRSQVFKDRRTPRGGARNKQRDYRSEEY